MKRKPKLLLLLLLLEQLVAGLNMASMLDAVFLAFGPLRGNSSSTAAAANYPTAISGIAALISGRCSLDPRLLPPIPVSAALAALLVLIMCVDASLRCNVW